MQFIYQHLDESEALGGSEQLPESFDSAEEVLGLENLSAADLIATLDDYSEAELEAMGAYLAKEEASLTTGQMRLQDELVTESEAREREESYMEKIGEVRQRIYDKYTELAPMRSTVDNDGESHGFDLRMGRNLSLDFYVSESGSVHISVKDYVTDNAYNVSRVGPYTEASAETYRAEDNPEICKIFGVGHADSMSSLERHLTVLEAVDNWLENPEKTFTENRDMAKDIVYANPDEAPPINAEVLQEYKQSVLDAVAEVVPAEPGEAIIPKDLMDSLAKIPSDHWQALLENPEAWDSLMKDLHYEYNSYDISHYSGYSDSFVTENVFGFIDEGVDQKLFIRTVQNYGGRKRQRQWRSKALFNEAINRIDDLKFLQAAYDHFYEGYRYNGYSSEVFETRMAEVASQQILDGYNYRTLTFREGKFLDPLVAEVALRDPQYYAEYIEGSLKREIESRHPGLSHEELESARYEFAEILLDNLVGGDLDFLKLLVVRYKNHQDPSNPGYPVWKALPDFLKN